MTDIVTNRKQSGENQDKRRRSSFVQRQNLQRENTLFIGQYEDHIVLQHEIQEAVQDQPNLTRKQSIHLIKQAKQSVIESRKSTSLQTILAITNTMMGSAVLVLPINVLLGGLSLSMIVMTLMALVSYFTCAYVVKIQIYGESDFSEIIQRTLGKTFSKFFSFFSFLLLFLVSGVYFILLNSVTYALTSFIVQVSGGGTLPDVNSITFDSWSVQYQCLILGVPLFFLISMKELTPIIKLGSYGVLAVIMYMVFLVYIFIYELVQPDFKEDWNKNMKQFNNNFGAVAGTFSLAFFIHNAICQIMQNNDKQENNQRDLFVGYTNVYFIYGIVGIFGSIGILGNYVSGKNYSTICELFSSTDKKSLPLSIPAQFVNILFFFQLSTVLPILCFISRTQFFQMVYGTTHQITNQQALLYNIAFTLECVLFQFFTINPSIIIGISGAVCGFYIVYLLPFGIRIAAHYNTQKNSLSNEDTHISAFSSNDQSQIESQKEQIEIQHELDSDIDQSLLILPQNNVNKLKFSGKEGGKFQIAELSLWILISAIGIFMAVLQIATLIQSLIKDPDDPNSTKTLDSFIKFFKF